MRGWERMISGVALDRICEGFASDLDIKAELAETRRRTEWCRRYLVRLIRSRSGANHIALAIETLNTLRAKASDLASRVVGWGKLVDAMVGVNR
jgi:hypothetical protein